MNDENTKTTLKNDLEDLFSSKNIQYYIPGEYKPTDSTKSYNEKSNIKMIENSLAHLFSHIEVKKHSTLIDEIEFPGITSTVKGCLFYPGLNAYSGEAMNSGFKTPIHEDTKFEALGKLGNLGLGFINDKNIPIYKGGLEITFTRNINNNVFYL